MSILDLSIHLMSKYVYFIPEYARNVSAALSTEFQPCPALLAPILAVINRTEQNKTNYDSFRHSSLGSYSNHHIKTTDLKTVTAAPRFAAGSTGGFDVPVLVHVLETGELVPRRRVLQQGRDLLVRQELIDHDHPWCARQHCYVVGALVSLLDGGQHGIKFA